MTLALAALIVAALLAAIDLIRSRGQSLTSWGVLFLVCAVWIILKGGAVL